MNEQQAVELVQMSLPQRASHIARPVDNTAMSAYMACPREYHYGMVQHRRGRGTKASLCYGTAWHAVMEAHYRYEGDQTEVEKAAVMAWEPHGDPEDHRTLDRLMSEYPKYLAKWGNWAEDSRINGRTVGSGESALIEKTAELWWPGALHPYTGKIDRIFEQHGLFYVEDHKTTSAMGSNYFYQWDPSNQMMGYAVLARLLTELPIAGVRINAHAVLKTTSKFERQFITYDPSRLDEWMRNYNSWITRINDDYKKLESGDPSAFPANFSACSRKYGSCAYSGVCSNSPHLRQRILESDFDERPWDPTNPEDAE